MLASVKFYDDFALKTGEIDHVSAQGRLTAKFKRAQLSISQVTPEEAFVLGGSFSEPACNGSESLFSRMGKLSR